MFRFYILVFFIPLFIRGQSSFNLSKQEETKIYSIAIHDYLKALNKGDTLKFDTLFVGPAEYLSEVILPSEVSVKKIDFLKGGEAEGAKKLGYKRSFIFVNIVGAITPVRAEFIFITFVVAKELDKPAWRPQHNFVFHYKYDSKKKEYVFERQKLDYQYAKKPKSGD